MSSFIFLQVSACRTYVCYNEILRQTCPITIPESVVRNFVLEQGEEQFVTMLSSTTLKPEVQTLLSDNNISSEDQERLLKGLTQNPHDILWLNKCPQDLGYLLDVYQEERYPIKFDQKQMPVVINKKVDKIESIGKTDMSEGEMKVLIEQRTVVHARIYHKGTHWNCFYFTYKGLAGLESSFGTQKELYGLRKLAARIKSTENMLIFFGIHTANLIHLTRGEAPSLDIAA